MKVDTPGHMAPSVPRGEEGLRDGCSDCSSKGSEFKSQQPHGSSQPSIVGSNALFWPAGVHVELLHKNRNNFF